MYRKQNSKNKIVLLCKARPFLDKNTRLALYYLCINYANTAWDTCWRKKFTVNENMQYILFLIKTNLCTQGKFLKSRTF